ncbi:MAG: hypothetical protein NT162_02770 [Candidatus Woesebacteria bacterium]|nr:hypothetical protein [Candidatus Woesebacteria bacterium]
MWSLDAFANPSKTALAELLVHTHSGAKLHTRMDAKTASRRLISSSAGGFGVGVPSAIEMDAGLYTTDNLKAERASRK